ncbi:MAG: DUF6580 family putative transport protein [Pirellulaceae bacterium]
MFSPRALTLAALIVAAAATRLAPHWPNFTAIGAICLFGGACFRSRPAAFLVPLAAIALSDVLLTAFVYGPGMGPNYFSYVCFALTILLGMALRERVTLPSTTAAAVLAAVGFFLLSNFQVWLGGDGITYPRTLPGLVACYIAAIPFGLNMLYANLFYCGALFGGMELLKRQWPALARCTSSRPAIAQ